LGVVFFGEKIKLSLGRPTLIIIKAYCFDKNKELSLFYLGYSNTY